MDELDELDELDEFRPRTWGRPMGRSMAVFSAIHGAYHVLSQRMRLETADVGLSPSEAVVLATLLDAPRLTISVVRQRTGLRPRRWIRSSTGSSSGATCVASRRAP
jgi:hypothetical protein